jgi:hypothetical protein
VLFRSWVNATVDRNYLLTKAFLYVDDGTINPNHHTIILSSPATADQNVDVLNRQTQQIVPATRVIGPGQALELRHGPALMADYVQASIELSHIVSP